MTPSLVDFGFAVDNSDKGIPKNNMICGTPNYMAPEVVGEDFYSLKVDVWALGVIMYYLAYSVAPFAKKNVKLTYKEI